MPYANTTALRIYYKRHGSGCPVLFIGGVGGDLRSQPSIFDSYLADYLATPEERPSVLASSLVACLEMAKEGELEIRQEKAFKPLYLRSRTRNGVTANVES